MAAKAHEAYAGYHQKNVEFLFANLGLLTDSAKEIVTDIHNRKPETLSAKQIKMLKEMRDKADATARARKAAGAAA